MNYKRRGLKKKKTFDYLQRYARLKMKEFYSPLKPIGLINESLALSVESEGYWRSIAIKPQYLFADWKRDSDEQLKKQLNEAIESEDYDRAAQIRDELKRRNAE